MALFKTDFFGFFAFGFAAGAALLAATADRDAGSALVQGIVPSATAATAPHTP